MDDAGARMTKNRLELFSDGVFAILLTLLVLDLRLPSARGAAGMAEIARPSSSTPRPSSASASCG